jgi:hypothetical protein
MGCTAALGGHRSVRRIAMRYLYRQLRAVTEFLTTAIAG